MKPGPEDEFLLFAGSASRKLGGAIAEFLGCPLGMSETLHFSEGTLFVRWQKLPDNLAPDAQGVREARLVKLSALPVSLPRVTPEERRSKLAARAAAYARRFAE